MAERVTGGNGDLQVQNLINDAQARAAQNAPSAADDGDREAIRKAAEKRLAIKQAGVQKQSATETFDKKGAASALYDEAFSGKMGPDVQRWAQDPQLQNKLTGAQKRLFLESIKQSKSDAAQSAPGAANASTALSAAAAINRLASAPSFAPAVPTSRSMGEVHQAVAQNPRIAAPLQSSVLDSRFMQSPKADAATKADFLRFGIQNMQKGNLQSVKVAGDMLGSLAGSQTPALGQRAAMKMAQRDPTNEVGMKNIDGFVQQPEVRGMPSMARGRATEVLARADGDGEVRTGLESVAKDNTFTGLGREDKARVFSTIGQGRTSDFRAITDKVLLTLQSTDFPARQGQVSKLLTQMGTQVQQTGADGINPRAIIRASKKSDAPIAPAMVSTANIDPEDEEAMTKARSQNRASVMKYYNQVAGHHDDVGEKLESAKYFEDVSMLSGLRPAEELDTSALDVSDTFKSALSEQIDTLKQTLTGSGQQAKKAQYNDKLKTLAQDVSQALGRPLTVDEGTLVLVQSKQAQSELRFNDLTRTKNQRMRELRGQRMPPAKRQAQAAERRVVGEQPQYFNPGANRAARGAFGPASAPKNAAGRNAMPQSQGLGRQGQTSGAFNATQGPVLPRSPALPQDAPQPARRAQSSAQATSRDVGAASSFGAASSVEDEVQQLMRSLDPSLSPAAKMGQARQMMADQLQRHIDVASRMMSQLMADPVTAEAAAETQQQSVPQSPRGKGSSATGAPAAAAFAQPQFSAVLNTGELSLPTAEEPIAQRSAAAEPSSGQGPDEVQSEARARSAAAMSASNQSAQLGEAQARPLANLSAVEAIDAQRPRGAAVELVARVTDAAARSEAGPQAGKLAKEALGALGVNLNAPAAAPMTPVAPQALAAFSSAALAAPQAPTVQGKVDGWGIPRTFERDLGATGAPTVRSARNADGANQLDAGMPSAVQAPEQYTGRTMVKSSTPVRDVSVLQQTPWKQLTGAESALLKNLGWAQKSWDTQTQPKTQWPRSMSTPYAQLSPKHREAVKRLGLSADDWDSVVGAGGAGGGGASHR